ncbi:MAG: DoxX family protein [Bacteroidetes bacterium]|nr:DoxX family protein [Bacteroidota bacterium]
MKILVGFVRIFVGIFFIISGLVKLIDPIGFSFKLQDYFAPDILNLPAMEPFALWLSVIVVVFEVLLGVMLILGYAKRFTLLSLLGMIVFFTFLTFYSAYYNKVTDCGCFGSAMKMEPWTSFWKDIVLLVLVLILFYGRKYIQPFFTANLRSFAVLITLMFSLWLSYHVLMHLPVIDFRPYKVGANIQEGMSVPDNAPAPIIQYNWEYEINGKNEVISNTTGQDPKPEGGTRVGVETEFLREPYEPPIHDFSMERDGEDFTEALLEEEHLVMVIAYNLDVTEHPGYLNIKSVTDEALKKGYTVIGMSASSTEETEALAKRHGLNFDFYFCDMTTLKTIVRSNPGVLVLEKGTVMQKVHWNDVGDISLDTLETAIPKLNFKLKRQLDSIMVLDQKYRDEDYFDNFKLQNAIDSTNLVFVEKVFAEYGYPGKSMVGKKTEQAAWYVVQHSNKIPEYLPLMKEAAASGELDSKAVAMMEDRFLMGQGKEQIYGTQGYYINFDSDKIPIIWPVADPENVEARRQKIGYTTDLNEYGKLMFGEAFEYRAHTLYDVKRLEKENVHYINLLKDL